MGLGHLKAYWAEHTLTPDTEEAQTLEAIRSKILHGHLVLLNLALRFSRILVNQKFVDYGLSICTRLTTT
jgi:hypothetical protein